MRLYAIRYAVSAPEEAIREVLRAVLVEMPAMEAPNRQRGDLNAGVSFRLHEKGRERHDAAGGIVLHGKLGGRRL